MLVLFSARLRRHWLILPAAIVALAVIWAILWPLTNALASHDVSGYAAAGRAAHLQSAREAARTQLLTLGAGLFAAAALIYTALNFRLSQQGQVTDRYTRAIEQIGSDKLDVRIGGIFALERIARDSARDHPTVMEVLAAFIREHSGDEPASPAPDDRDDERFWRTTRADVHAAVTVLGRRNTAQDVGRGPDLSGAVIRYADLTGSNFRNALFFHADLTGLILRHANLTRAIFSGTKLTGANLEGADLTGAWFDHDVPVPKGWMRDDKDRLKQSSRSS